MSQHIKWIGEITSLLFSFGYYNEANLTQTNTKIRFHSKFLLPFES